MHNRQQLGAAVFATAAAAVVGILAYRRYKESTRSKSLLEQIGGEAAVDAAVNLFYKKMLADERVRVFFVYTNMAHQVQRQKNFLLYVLDAGNRHKYHGLSMDKAHARLITEGIKDPQTGKVHKMDDSHFNATAENLQKTFEELNVPKHLIDTIMGAVESLREQVMCRGKYAAALKPAAPSLLDQIGGEAAVDAAVSLFYKKMLADERVRVFFTYTNMAHQSQRQKNFLLYVLDAGNRHKYHGLSMDKAHARLITEGIKDPQTGKVYKMDDSHFNATAENLKKTFEELGVPKHLIDTILGAVESLREQVMCRGQYAAALQTVKPAAPSLLEQVGGEAAVDAAVSLFYKKMLADERVRVFFAYTNMAHQAQRQKNFLLYVLDAGNRHKYHGLSMDKAHARLITQGIKDPPTGKVYKMDDSHFNATAENLQKTFEELNVPKPLIDTIMGAVEGLREQVMCRGKYAAALEESKKA